MKHAPTASLWLRLWVKRTTGNINIKNYKMLSYRRETALQDALVLAKNWKTGTLFSRQCTHYTKNHTKYPLEHPN